MDKGPSFDEIETGQEVPSLSKAIDKMMMVQYCGASEDYATVHWDHEFMIKQGFPNVVVQGWLTFAWMTQAVTKWIPLERSWVDRYAVRYRKPSFPGLLSFGGAVTGKRVEEGRQLVDFDLWSKDEDGQVTTTATMTLQML